MRSAIIVGAFVAVAAVVGLGCSSKRPSSFLSSSEVSAGSFPASAISQNNVAQDGGGLSNNNQTASFGQFQCSFNNRNPNCDAPSTADGSAVFFFVTANNPSAGQTGGTERVYVSYWNGSQFGPPQEITAKDRNEALQVGSACATHAASVVLIPLNTQVYFDALPDPNPLVEGNTGSWAILWDYETFSQSPELVIGDLAAASNAAGNGAHHTVALNWIIRRDVNVPDTITNLIGNTASVGAAPNGPNVELKFGIQIEGTEITTETAGASSGAIPAGAPGPGVQAAFVDQSGNLYRPASDIVSYGAATDTFCKCACFGSNFYDPSGLVPTATSGDRLGNIKGGQARLGPTEAAANGTLVQNPNGATPAQASYTNGDNTTFLQLFWCQLVTSHAGANTTTFTPPGTGVSPTQVGPMYRFFTANVNLATLAIGPPQIVPFPTAARNRIIDGSIQALPDFCVYNNLVFWNYVDASLAVSPANQHGVQDAIISSIAGGPKAVSVALACLSITEGVAGAAAINTTNQFDVTLLGTAGHHQNTNSTAPGTASPVNVGEEIVTLPGVQDFCGCPMIGPDDGQVDLTAFAIGRITTTSVANSVAGHGNLEGDTDNELWAVAVNATGATAGTLVAGGKNPFRVSNHVADPLPPASTASPSTLMHDDVHTVSVTLNRTGVDALVTFLQAQGTSSVANFGLLATVYRPFRVVGSLSSATITTVPTLDQRFPTAGPVQVNTPSLTAYVNQNADIGTFGPAPGRNGFAGSPVAAYQVQGFVGYKCGFQTDTTVMSVTWLHADGTSERVFVKNVSYANGPAVTDPPTITATGTEAELEASNLVSTSGTGAPTQFAVPFLPGTFSDISAIVGGIPDGVPRWSAASGATLFFFCSNLNRADTLLTVDAGPDATGHGGDTLIVFTKVTDDTTSDGNFFDKKCIAVLYDGTTLTRTVLSKNIIEDVPSLRAFRTNLVGIVPVASTPNLNTPGTGGLAGGHPPDGGVYVYFTGPNNDNASSPAGLYTRHFKARTAGGTLVTFAQNFFPDTTPATFVDPVRIDRDLDSTVTGVQTFTRGRQVEVLFIQDNHVWGSITADGQTYTNTGGLPTPALFDNNFSVNGNVGDFITFQASCPRIDPDCDNTSGTPVFFVKDDVDLNPRLYVRVLQ